MGIMPSPFPGMDPYIECSNRWLDFHGSFNTYLRDALLETLPEAYDARLNEYASIVAREEDEPQNVYGDVTVVGRPAETDFGGGSLAGSTLAVAEPTATLELPFGEPEPHTFLEIRLRGGEAVVTIIELLSPSNKTAKGQGEFEAKRLAALRRRVNWVEIDLLTIGHRIELAEPLPRGDYYATVIRAAEPTRADVFAWSVRDRLPTIPVPLRPPDGDVPLDLAAVFAIAYDRGRYRRVVRYDRPLGISADEATKRWVEECAAAQADSKRTSGV
jgi:hypothetical protein